MNILKLTKLVLFKKMDDFLGWDVDVGFRQWRNDLLIFLRSNDVDLDVLQDEMKLNNEVANF